MNKYFSTADLIVIVVTMVLFIAALFTKGLTHDLFLEAGVLLVSIKIIMMNHKSIMANQVILTELKDIKERVSERNHEGK